MGRADGHNHRITLRQLSTMIESSLTMPEPTSRRRLWMRFIGGMVWLAFVAGGLWGLSGYPFAAVYAVTVCASLVAAGVAIAWLTHWATNRNARRRQFGIASLFYFITLTSMYLAVVRWVVVHLEARAHVIHHWPTVVMVGLWTTLVMVASCPIVFGITEALLRCAVWFLHWSPARPLLKLLFRRRK